MKGAEAGASISLPAPCCQLDLSGELATLASSATAEALGAADACWQEMSRFRFVFMCPGFPGSSHRPPPQRKALGFKGDKCHPGHKVKEEFDLLLALTVSTRASSLHPS